jgi:hypothetical protein
MVTTSSGMSRGASGGGMAVAGMRVGPGKLSAPGGREAAAGEAVGWEIGEIEVAEAVAVG